MSSAVLCRPGWVSRKGWVMKEMDDLSRMWRSSTHMLPCRHDSSKMRLHFVPPSPPLSNLIYPLMKARMSSVLWQDTWTYIAWRLQYCYDLLLVEHRFFLCSYHQATLQHIAPFHPRLYSSSMTSPIRYDFTTYVLLFQYIIYSIHL